MGMLICQEVFSRFFKFFCDKPLPCSVILSEHSESKDLRRNHLHCSPPVRRSFGFGLRPSLRMTWGGRIRRTRADFEVRAAQRSMPVPYRQFMQEIPVGTPLPGCPHGSGRFLGHPRTGVPTPLDPNLGVPHNDQTYNGSTAAAVGTNWVHALRGKTVQPELHR